MVRNKHLKVSQALEMAIHLSAQFSLQLSVSSFSSCSFCFLFVTQWLQIFRIYLNASRASALLEECAIKSHIRPMFDLISRVWFVGYLLFSIHFHSHSVILSWCIQDNEKELLLMLVFQAEPGSDKERQFQEGHVRSDWRQRFILQDSHDNCQHSSLHSLHVLSASRSHMLLILPLLVLVSRRTSSQGELWWLSRGLLFKMFLRFSRSSSRSHNKNNTFLRFLLALLHLTLRLPRLRVPLLRLPLQLPAVLVGICFSYSLPLWCILLLASSSLFFFMCFLLFPSIHFSFC